MKKTVIILGAGASADYGFPLWAGLKQQMLDLDLDKELSETLNLRPEEVEAHKTAFGEFQQHLTREPDATLDRIAFLIDQPKSKHLRPTGHYLINLAGYLLSKIECEKQDGKWVSEFQTVLLDYLASQSAQFEAEQNHLQNLTVISLNYDRVFERFVSNGFFKRLIEHSEYDPPSLAFSINFSRNNRLSVLKPHGYISGLAYDNGVSHVGMNNDLVIVGGHTQGIRHPGNDLAIGYGEHQLLCREAFLRMGRHMYVVDERDVSDYQAANQALMNAEQVFCLGLSPAGLCQSSFAFKESQKVYLSNKGEEVSGIAACKGPADFESLGTRSERMNSSDFPAKFKSLTFDPT
ncbi:hypothetical protein [Phaeobacter inhibens]|uniref:hypothetical protein n=1 Tax=Phaeobacter inhibens TaxID=221822 RepID=UPI0021A88C23|nr:hypothetical protein [Phaeobacter inhibens]UWR51654.1 hypothetical protein K4F84_10540 [Phaeobacter inhibens]UWR67218.1 hypothetical protein K4K95_10650 [Phaeobacter inhibens]UWR71032.1 hypothetical protein K4L00_09975 [Phaeobacter inhibens]